MSQAALDGAPASISRQIHGAGLGDMKRDGAGPITALTWAN